MKFIDAAPIDGVRMHDDGYLVADARIVRTGIQNYTGREVGKPELPIVRVYRPESEVFHKDSLASFSHIPVTDDHPSVAVNADNWKDLAVGETSGEVLRDGERLRIPLIVKHGTAIQKVRDGKRELSAGYTCDLVFEDGTTPSGEPYDAIQKNIRANHLAIVQRGRAGSECRIGDDASGSWGAAPIIHADGKGPDMPDTLRKVLVDGYQVETTDAGAHAIEKLTKDRDTAQTALIKAEKDHADAITAKDEEIGTLKADKKKLEDAQMTPERVTKLVADRVALESTAKAIVADVKVEGVADADIRKAVVLKKYGAEFVGDASDGEIVGMFKALAKDAKADPVRDALNHPAPTGDNTVVVDAYQQMVTDLHNAHRPAAAN